MLNDEIKDILSEIGIEIIYVKENINDINPLTIPDHCGVYIIITESGKRYVGSSTNIYRRIMFHKCNAKFKPFKEPIKSVSVYLVEEEAHARILEKLFIYRLKPELNGQGLFKTVTLDDNTYENIKKIQSSISEELNIEIHISQILEYLIPERDKAINIISKKMLERSRLISCQAALGQKNKLR